MEYPSLSDGFSVYSVVKSNHGVLNIALNHPLIIFVSFHSFPAFYFSLSHSLFAPDLLLLLVYEVRTRAGPDSGLTPATYLRRPNGAYSFGNFFNSS